jgi:hypothetical protein
MIRLKYLKGIVLLISLTFLLLSFLLAPGSFNANKVKAISNYRVNYVWVPNSFPVFQSKTIYIRVGDTVTFYNGCDSEQCKVPTLDIRSDDPSSPLYSVGVVEKGATVVVRGFDSPRTHNYKNNAFPDSIWQGQRAAGTIVVLPINTPTPMPIPSSTQKTQTKVPTKVPPKISPVATSALPTPTPIPTATETPVQDPEALKEEIKAAKKFELKVTDAKGKPLANATVILFKDENNTAEGQTITKTNDSGIAEFAEVKEGIHKVMISYNGTNHEKNVEIKAGELQQLDYKVTTKEDKTNYFVFLLSIVVVTSGLSIAYYYFVKRKPFIEIIDL